MKYFLILLFSFSSYALNLEIDKSIYQKVKFISHSGSGKYSNYLAMNINFNPIKKIHLQLENHLKTKLISRGEAHITVLTPPEYNTIKKFNLNVKILDQIAKSHQIQQSQFTPKCLGRGHKNNMNTYFIVIESADLINIRKKIFDYIKIQGATTKDFDYKIYYPHITIGFDKRDLHISDGIIKDENTCWSNF